MAVAQPRPRSPARLWWNEFLAVRPGAGTRWGAVRVGVSVAAALGVVLALGRPGWAVYAVCGSICSVYGKRYDYGGRLRAQLGMGAGLLLALGAGTAASAVSGPGSAAAVALMAAMSAAGVLATRVSGWLPNPALFFVLAAGTASSAPHQWSDVALGAAIAAVAVVASAALGQAGRIGAHFGRAPAVVAEHRFPGWSGRGLGRQLLQHAMGPLVAGSAVAVMGLGHPHWAAVAATVPLVGSTLAAQLARAAHRLAGTLVGCLLALSLLAAHPPAAVLVLAISALQVATELLVTRHYGIAVICITPLALLLTQLGAPAPVDVLIGGRLDKSLLGVSAAVAILLVTRIRRPRADRSAVQD